MISYEDLFKKTVDLESSAHGFCFSLIMVHQKFICCMEVPVFSILFWSK